MLKLILLTNGVKMGNIDKNLNLDAEANKTRKKISKEFGEKAVNFWVAGLSLGQFSDAKTYSKYAIKMDDLDDSIQAFIDKYVPTVPLKSFFYNLTRQTYTSCSIRI